MHAHADASVRPALPEDATALGRIQVHAWRQAYQDQLPAPVLASLDPVAFAHSWRAAIESPPSAKHRVLTACDGPRVVGFAAIAPTADGATAEIIALEVDPEHARHGHGSRLLAACADVLRASGAGGVRTWAVEGDEARVAFLTDAGFAPAGQRRTLDAGGATVRQICWSAGL